MSTPIERITPWLVAGVLAGFAAAGPGIQVTTEILADALNMPTSLTVAPGDTERLYFTERQGLIHIIRNGEHLATPFLDITDRVSWIDAERALACLAFHPDYETNGFFYVCYTNLDDDSVISRFSVTADPEVADPASEVILLTHDQPGPNHNLDWLGFGPDPVN